MSVRNGQKIPAMEKSRRLLQLLRENPKITQRECAKLLDLSLGGTKYHFDNLQKRGIVRRVGTQRSGCWEILDKAGEDNACSRI